VVVGETGADVVGASRDQGPHLVDGGGAVPAGGTFGDHQRADGLDQAVTALEPAGRRARLGRSGRADRVERVGLALAAPGRAVSPVDLDHRHPGCPGQAGQASTVGPGALDPDPVQRSETVQPGQKRPTPGRGGRERLHPQQTADGIKGSRHMDVQVGVDTAGHSPAHYCGHGHPFHG
jgi:hypothetical protein